MLIDFYSGNLDSLFIKLKSSGYEHTAIKSYYDEYVTSTLAMPDGNLGLIAGYWMPQGKNKLLGNHPSFGFFLGGKKKKFMADVVILFRFLSAKETYVVKREGGFESTKKFFGGYIGVEGGRELLRTRHHGFDLSAGMGFDGFDALDKNQQHDAVTISSFNFNLGLGYRYFSHEFQTKYIGMQVRYNFVRYATHGGSDLSGNTISLRLLLGLGGNQKKNQRLKSLEYHY
ncbi:hypothetical protein L0337_39360 [candidate division KSB1 bacterium]|nr:hypothetical protein [candidate division KSB1 bacterium]